MATTVLDGVSAFLAESHGLFIGGEEVEARNGERFDVHNPATGEVIAGVPSAGSEDVDEAVRAASGGLPAWRDLPPVACGAS